jgi:hypothetical protein
MAQEVVALPTSAASDTVTTYAGAHLSLRRDHR